MNRIVGFVRSSRAPQVLGLGLNGLIGSSMRCGFASAAGGGGGGKGLKGKEMTDSEKFFHGEERPMAKFKDLLATVDTTLTPGQRERVERLKEKFLHGASGKHSPYRNVPTQAEQDSIPNSLQYRPFVPGNADALIDWALSHVPERAGKRGTRRAKRMAQKWELKRKNDAYRKEGEQKSRERKAAKALKQRELGRLYRTLGAELREQAAAVQAVKMALDSGSHTASNSKK